MTPMASASPQSLPAHEERSPPATAGAPPDPMVSSWSEKHVPPPRVFAIVSGVVFAAAALPVLAHGGGEATGAWWTWWPVAPSILITTFLVAWWYIHGFRKRRLAERASRLEAVSVLAGIAMILLALHSPIDPLGERSYSMHQVQHLLLRTVAPMLIFLPSPAATFVAGLPKRLRRVMARLGGNGVLRTLLGILTHPAVVTFAVIATAWIWQWPPYFSAALRDEGIHYLMHFTMIGTGLLFWWRIFDDRPSSPRYGVRIVMLWAFTATTVILGVILTNQGSVIYPVYDELGRLWLSAATDETVGGLIAWIPGAQMALIGFIVVIRRWGRRETRNEARRTRVAATGELESSPPKPGGAAVPGIRRQALALGVLSAGIVVIFVAWIGVAVLGSA